MNRLLQLLILSTLSIIGCGGSSGDSYRSVTNSCNVTIDGFDYTARVINGLSFLAKDDYSPSYTENNTDSSSDTISANNTTESQETVSTASEEYSEEDSSTDEDGAEYGDLVIEGDICSEWGSSEEVHTTTTTVTTAAGYNNN